MFNNHNLCLELLSVVTLEFEREKIIFYGKNDQPAIIKREKRTVEFMVQIYCNAKHRTKDDPCLECVEFLEYIKDRLDNCPFQAKKTGCGICGLSCYEPDKKDKGLEVFNYSGPRMFLRHPAISFRHLMDMFNQPNKPI